MPVFLVIREIDSTTEVNLTSKTIILGRSSKCNIKINDALASAKHMAVKLNPGGLTIVKDLESTNGTFVNGSKTLECYLYLDDIIKIGNSIEIFLDASRMTPKEKNIHTREGQKTQITYIDLQVPKGDDTQETKSVETKDPCNKRIRKEHGVELEKSSGATKMIKVEKLEKKKKSKVKKKKPQKKVETSLVSKIKGIFKKD